MNLDNAYFYATDCLDWLGELWASFDPEWNLRLKRQTSDGLSEHEAKMLSLCRPLQEWLDAGALPKTLAAVNSAPVERFGIAAPSVHQLTKELMGAVVMRICEVVHPGSTRDFSPYWGNSELPGVDYDELLHADRFAVQAAIRLEFLEDKDFTWLGAALFQEYERAKILLGANADESAKWPKQAEVARRLETNKMEVHRLIERGELQTNGESGHTCRVDPASIIEYCHKNGIAYNDT